MAEIKAGSVVSFERLSPVLALFRLRPEPGGAFPQYKAGQYIALRRDDCKLTRREPGPDGKPRYVPDLDADGRQRIGSVTHSYSISSAPFETQREGWLEFYVVLEQGKEEYPGRLTESIFRIDPPHDGKLSYVNRIVGDFTLDKRANGSAGVLMVGTGTGLAPFASMLKQLDHEASEGRRDPARYTLIHANRTFAELAYHRELQAIEARARLDFVYVASVSRPAAHGDASVGTGRANNLLRLVSGLPTREEEDLHTAEADGVGVEAARAELARSTRPELPAHLNLEALRRRLDPARTVLLTCGNPSSMSDIQHVAGLQGFRFEKEDWKLASTSPRA